MMRAARNGKERVAEAIAPSPAVNAGAIRAADTPNLHLHLIRVQSDATARRGRGLVRFITDLVQREDKPIPVVAECPHCGRFYNVEVDLRDANDPTVLRLPDNCRRCATSLDTSEMIHALVKNARYYRDTATPVGAA
jgi:hypothetical protein